MGETKKQNAEPSTGKATSVIDYIVQRLADEGITDCFGVPGDYAFPVCDAVERNPNIRISSSLLRNRSDDLLPDRTDKIGRLPLSTAARFWAT